MTRPFRGRGEARVQERYTGQRANPLRLGHYSLRTEQAYVTWVRRFVKFHALRHPAELGEAGVTGFLRHLAGERHVAAATQGQA